MSDRDSTADIRGRDLSDIAQAISERVPPCPWNPFPWDSPWGREIERRYQEEQRRQRRKDHGHE